MAKALAKPVVPAPPGGLPPVVLASASPRRAELLRELGLEFHIVPGNPPEAEHDFLTPREICLLNAHRKARLIAKHSPDSLVIGADTVVALGNTIFGKPAALEDARRTLAQLQNQTHLVLTGVCLIHLRRHQESLFSVTTKVRFRPLTPAQIDDYLARINPLDKAGGYAIQEHGKLIVKSISGSYSNVVGLPVERLQSELKKFTAGRPGNEG